MPRFCYYSFIFIFCVIAEKSFGQSTAFGTDTENESSRAICTDLNGNMYVGGKISDDIFITKLNNQFNIIWSKRIELPYPGAIVNTIKSVGDTIFGCGYIENDPNANGGFFFKMNAVSGNFYWIKSTSDYENIFVDMTYSNGKYFVTGRFRNSQNGLLVGRVIAFSSQTGNMVWATPGLCMYALWLPRSTTINSSTEMINGKMFIVGAIEVGNYSPSNPTIWPVVLGINETGTVFMSKYLQIGPNSFPAFGGYMGVSIEFDGSDSLVVVLGKSTAFGGNVNAYTVLMKSDLELNGGFIKSYNIGGSAWSNPNTLTITDNNYVIYGGSGPNTSSRMFILKLDKQGNPVKCVGLTKANTQYHYPLIDSQDYGFGNADFKNGKHYFPTTEFIGPPNDENVNPVVMDENLEFVSDCSELNLLPVVTYSLPVIITEDLVQYPPHPNLYSNVTSTSSLTFPDVCANRSNTFNEVVSCNNGTTITSVSTGFSNPHYQWSNGSTDATQVVYTNDTLIVTITDSKCCYIIDTIVPQISYALPLLHLPPDTVICSNGSFSYVIVPTVDSNSTSVVYHWNNGENTPQLTVTTAGIYWLDVTNSCGTVRDSIVVVESLLPTISGVSSLEVCAADFPVQYEPDQVNNATSVYWENNSTTPNRSIDSAGTYILTAVNSCGEASFTVDVTIIPLPQISWITSLDTCIAVGQMVDLSPTYSNVDNVIWSTNQISTTIQVDDSGIYTVTGSNVCGTTSASANINVNFFPQLYLPQNLDTCFDIGIGFPYTAQGSPGNYIWSSGSQSATELITQNGIYTVTLSNACGSVSQSMVVNRVSDISLTVGIDSILSCEGSILPESLQIETNYDYEILNSGLVVQHGRISATGWYYIRAFNKCGDAFDSVYIDLQEEQVFYIPNSFTPNNDGVNEYYTWNGENVMVSDFRIFNRWGEMVFDGSDLQGWNGTYEGLPCPVGVYTVRVLVQNCVGIVQEHVGFVALLR